jgi:superfamily II DNA helicase RecQ
MKSSVLCATGALGAGVDIDGIKFVIHCGKPYGMINFD